MSASVGGRPCATAPGRCFPRCSSGRGCLPQPQMLREVLRRSVHLLKKCALSWYFLGGAKGIRTPDLLDANESRYQLRHSPWSVAQATSQSAGTETRRRSLITARPPSAGGSHRPTARRRG